MIKALFFDIDGTLVSFKTHCIPQSTIDAINEVRKKGIKVFIATGRPKIIINNLGDLKFDGFITMNGAFCYIEDEVIHENSIPNTDVKTAVQLVTDRNITCVFVTENKMSLVNPSQLSDEFSKDLAVQQLPQISIDEILQEDIYQMSPFITSEEEPEFMAQIPGCEAGRWHPTFVDVVAKGNGKDRGIDEVIKRIGIKLEETMAFGDGGNDISMLRHAGIGVAMGNAKDHVKAVANYVTDSVDNDGILKALKHFNLVEN
ncbi:Cof-type HAD-IIB family hydrolase [Bacteroides sp. 224]|uniref:Cof-type HAD-IIB family hydrolase n=1 Tax=Bacteroides sp. 224 TaxID=2302936 RepID=UPI0013D0DF59|nr:Cof-type HAD-IIB family hydrolase [Bacteroides sp. 224]NDV65966.1 Cof-type HAD-IIB family hydrolase [Bacteroides sp. 224]